LGEAHAQFIQADEWNEFFQANNPVANIVQKVSGRILGFSGQSAFDQFPDLIVGYILIFYLITPISTERRRNA
jgi:hypothetical protein